MFFVFSFEAKDDEEYKSWKEAIETSKSKAYADYTVRFFRSSFFKVLRNKMIVLILNLVKNLLLTRFYGSISW